MNTITKSPRGDRREAEAWLARELRWERLLDQLRGARTGAVRTSAEADVEFPQERAVRRSEAA